MPQPWPVDKLPSMGTDLGQNDAPEAAQDVSAGPVIKLPDEHTRRVVECERLQRGDSTGAKTARSMIHERAAELARQRAADAASQQPPARLADHPAIGPAAADGLQAETNT